MKKLILTLVVVLIASFAALDTKAADVNVTEKVSMSENTSVETLTTDVSISSIEEITPVNNVVEDVIVIIIDDGETIIIIVIVVE